jgi:hypothetical protein
LVPPAFQYRTGGKNGNEEAGAEQIENEDEDPAIRDMYVRNWRQKG